MPNGYDWLARSHETEHSFARWVIQTGKPSPGLASTCAGFQPAADVNMIGDAYRVPDELESRLIDVVLMPPTQFSKFVPTFQCDEYKKKMYVEDKAGTCRWAAPVDHVVASAWEITVDHELRWVDAVPALAGVGGGRDSSNLIVLKTSWLYELHGRKKPVKRGLRSLEFAIALRQIVDTVVSVPMLRPWNNEIEELIWVHGNSAIAQNLLQRSLVANHSYCGGVQGGPMLDTTIWFEARDLEEFHQELRDRGSESDLD